MTVLDGAPTGRDRAWAAGVGGLVAALAWTWGAVDLPCDAWEDVAVAAGLRPPREAGGALWHALAALLFGGAGLDAGIRIVRLLGPATLGLTAYGAFLLIFGLVPLPMRLRMGRVRWSRRVLRMIVAQGALLFACAEPVWRQARYLSPDFLLVALSLLAASLAVRAWRRNVPGLLYVAAALAGLLAAETPAGWAMLAAGYLCVWRQARATPDTLVNPLANDLVRRAVTRRLLLAFAGGLLVGTAVDAAFFAVRDGFAANGWSGFDYAVRALARPVRRLVGAATGAGWLFQCVCVFLPMALAARLVGCATDDDAFLPYAQGLFFVAAGLVAILQSAGWPSFWCWTWFAEGANVESGVLLGAGAFAGALTATFALCVLGTEIYLRDYRRIASIRYEDAAREPVGARVAASFRLLGHAGRMLAQAEPLLLLALVLPPRTQGTARAMAASVDDFVRETAAECGDAGRLFTDGVFDAAIEVCAARQGRTLHAVSLLSGSSPRESFVRARGAGDDEDRAMLETGAAETLRTWMRQKPARLADVALQLGIEMWKRDHRPLPPCGGFVARPDGFPQPDRTAAAHALADRILALYARARPMDVPDQRLKTAFTFAQWRLARMCRWRADRLDAARDTAAALAESRRAESLDEANDAYRRIRRQMDWVGRQRGTLLTPREGLRIGLDRADFRMARVFARQVLAADPDDTPANFAMGMAYFDEEQYARAETYLRRCLVRSPDEPAVLNNLAVALLELGRLDEAEANARRALRLLPDDTGVRATLRDIEARRATRSIPSP